MTTRYFSDFGAEVLRVESSLRPDVIRHGLPFAEGKPGTNRSGYWANYNSGKLGLGLNMGDERARHLAFRPRDRVGGRRHGELHARHDGEVGARLRRAAATQPRPRHVQRVDARTRRAVRLPARLRPRPHRALRPHQLHRLAGPRARQSLRRVHGLPHPPHSVRRRLRRAGPQAAHRPGAVPGPLAVGSRALLRGAARARLPRQRAHPDAQRQPRPRHGPARGLPL